MLPRSAWICSVLKAVPLRVANQTSAMLRIAPSAVTPSVLPMLRANSSEAVALPRFDHSTLPWIITTQVIFRRPMPNPMMAGPNPMNAGGVVGVTNNSEAVPSGMSAPPSRSVWRVESTLRMREDTAEASGQANSIADSGMPARIAGRS